jgi:3-methyladenine DNA glycosylase AlkD
MNVDAVMKELESLGSAQTKKTWINHGCKGPLFGVKIGDMKPIVKRVKKDHELSLGLYATGNADAMYLAGLIADENKITKAHLQKWVDQADWGMLAEYTVPWVAAESPFGWELGLKWIESKKEMVATAGWAALANVVSLKPDEELDIKALEGLLARVKKEIHSAPNRVRYVMNGFVIAVGCYVVPLSAKAMQTAKAIGKVDVFMGNTACKVPDAPEYIAKVADMDRVGKKRKMARC